MANFDPNAIPDALAVQKAQKELSSSSTALTPGVTPTSQDVGAQTTLEAAQAKQQQDNSDQMRRLFYGNRSAADVAAAKAGGDQGFWGKTLKFLGIGTSLGSGAASYALGKGTSSDFKQNELDAFKRGSNYGDTIRQFGTPNLIAAPLGFALDVGLDPINWMTVGDAALVPRVGVGLAKGGIEGAAEGAKSWGLDMAAKAVRGVEGLQSPSARYFTNYQLNPANFADLDKMHPALAKLAQKVSDSNERYDALAHGGMDYLERYADGKEGAVVNYINNLKDKAGNKLGELAETPVGRAFKYSSSGQSQEAFGAEEDAYRDMQASGLDKVGRGEFPKTRYDMRGSDLAKKLMTGEINGNKLDELDQLTESVRAALDDSEKLKFDAGLQDLKDQYLTGDPATVASINRMLGSGIKKVSPELFVSVFDTFKTDVDGYNKALLKIMSANPAAVRILQAYGILGNVMRVGSIGLSFPARVNALMSNLAFASMGGIDIASTGYMRAARLASNYINKGDDAALREMMAGADWYDAAREIPNSFRSITAVNPDVVTGGRQAVESHIDRIIAAKRQAGATADELEKLYEFKKTKGAVFDAAVQEEMRASRREALAAQGSEWQKAQHAADTAVVPENNPMAGTDLKTTFHVQEMNTSIARKMIKDLKRAEAKGGVTGMAAKALRIYMQEPLKSYGKADQIARLTGLTYLTQYGFTEPELRKMMNWFKFDESEVIRPVDATGKIIKNGLYRLKPKAAMRMVEELHLNYAAMPSFVKIMKNLPFIGSNYFSFTYGAGANVIQTAINNPAFFNQANFLLNEIGGRKNPLEKQQLNSQYYSYLKAPEYMKWPFVQKNPVYINMAQALPHLSLNFFQDSNRPYADTYGGKIASIIDKSPFFKTPSGQVLLNYIIMPHLVGEAVNQFGQPLYAPGSSGAQIAGHAASDIINPFLPRTPVGVFGSLPGLVTDPSKLQYMPLTFRYPQEAANWGANPAGIVPASADALTFNKMKARLREAGINASRISEQAGTNPQGE